MSLVRRFTRGLHALVFRSRVERELDAELRAFLDAAIEAKMRDGASRADAERAARLELGSAAAVKDHVRDAGWESTVESFRQDVRYGARMLRRSPAFAATAIALLAVGIGANTAIFTLVNAVILRPLPVRNPSQLVEPLNRHPGDPRMNGFSWDFYEYIRDRNTSFAEVIGIFPARLEVRWTTAVAETVVGDYVVGSFFSALGLEPAIGRLIAPEDARPGAAPVAVLNWSYWKTRFNRDPAVLGAQISVNGSPATIIGVAPRAFTGLRPGIVPAVWLPVTRPTALGLLARLKPGVSIEQARAEMRVLYRWQMEQIAKTSDNPRFWLQADIDLEPAAAGFSALRDRFATPLKLLMTAVGVVLLIACTNVASLLLARATARRREMAVRVSLGAGRWRLARQVLTESLLLSAAATVLGVALANVWAGTLIRMMMSGRRPPGWPPQLDLQLAPDARVLLFTVAIASLTAVFFGLAPAWSAFTSPPVSSLREIGSAGDKKSVRLFSRALVVGQVALSVVLLTAAATFVAHLSRLRNHDLGFQRDGVLLVSLNPQGSGIDRAQLARRYRDLLDRFHAMPGVQSATLSGVTPIDGGAASQFVNVEGHVESPENRTRVYLNWIAPRYFEVFGTPLLSGRDFQFDDAGRPPVAIVNQAMARHYFGGASPIGRRIMLERETAAHEIVGVVADAKYADLHEAAPRTVYLNAFQGRIVSHFALRTSLTPTAVAPQVRRTVAELLPSVAIAKVTTLNEQVNASLVIERLIAALCVLFGVAAVTLAAVGMYGLMAYTVARRTNEIGLRLALGATQGDVLRMVLTGALSLVCTGAVVGGPIAWWTRRISARLVENLPAVSAWPIVFAALALLAAALLAAYIPARRAARIQPVDALRHV